MSFNCEGAVICQKTQHIETVTAPPETKTAPAAVTAVPTAYMQRANGENMLQMSNLTQDLPVVGA
jgi:hypothetical protein